MNASILITGANGLTGSAIVRQLSSKQIPVRILVRDRAKSRAQGFDSLDNVEIFEGDMGKPETLAGALNGIDRAMLISSSNQFMASVQNSFIDAAKESGVTHIVKLSGIIADINSPFRFARMHREIEQKLESSGLSYTLLRAGEFMQSYFRQLPNIISRNGLFLPMENQKIASIDVEDIAAVAVKVLTGFGHDEKIYTITGPEALTMAQVAEKISSVLGRKISYINIPPESAKKTLLDAGVPPYNAEGLEELFAERRKGMESKVYHTLEDVFGLHATNFTEFLIRNLQVFNGKEPAPRH